MQFFKYLVLLTISGVMLMWPFKKSESSVGGSAYDYSFVTLAKEEPMPLSGFKGKVLLIVNTASECGFTKQYDALEKLYEKYKDKGLVVIGVPSNEFGGQEPGSAEEIENFCKVNYGVTFPLTAKNKVVGDDAHPFYKWARETLGFAAAPKWNFHKYLVGKDGRLIDFFASATTPDADNLVKAVEKALEE